MCLNTTTYNAKIPTELVATYGIPSYDEEGEFVSNTCDYSIDVVGILHEPTGNTLTDDDGMEYPEMQAMDGWHVNIRLTGDAMRDTVEALDTTHGVKPKSPMRVWL